MRRIHLTTSLVLAAIALTLCGRLVAQAASPGPDVLLLKNGEKFLGHLKSATGASLVFTSEAAGDITVPWANVQALQSSGRFAIIAKGARLAGKAGAGGVPLGTITVSDGQVRVSSAAAQPTVPLTDLANLVPEADFLRAFRRPGLFEDWRGAATGGLALTEATQTNRTFTAAFHLTRVVPDVDWLRPRRRSTLHFNEAYGELTQPATPSVKTSLFHLDAEQDWFLSSHLFSFANAAWDHSFSQGLKLQQSYGGGVGWMALKRPNQELDAKASADYINQRFDAAGLNHSLVGTNFGQTYFRIMAHGVRLDQQAGITPTWNDLKAYSAFANAALTFPVYHRLGFTLGALDNYLNNPPPGFRKNSFQFTAGAAYAIH